MDFAVPDAQHRSSPVSGLGFVQVGQHNTHLQRAVASFDRSGAELSVGAWFSTSQ
jgi:hypothetical protein